MNFGEKLKFLRLEANLTQEALADRLGIKKQTISRYENSEREPNIRTAKKLADALGVSLESLVLGDHKNIKSDEKNRFLFSSIVDSMSREELLAALEVVTKKLKEK